MMQCTEHKIECNYIKAGVSKKTGKSYPAFYACPNLGCRAEKKEIAEESVQAEGPSGSYEEWQESIGTQQKIVREPVEDKKPDWDEINRGKVRCQVAVAFIGQGERLLTPELIEEMEKHVDYIMSGPSKD